MPKLLRKNECRKCEQYYNDLMCEEYEEGCQIERYIWEDCYLPKFVRKLLALRIQIRDWISWQRYCHADRLRMKAGVAEEDWDYVELKKIEGRK